MAQQLCLGHSEIFLFVASADTVVEMNDHSLGCKPCDCEINQLFNLVTTVHKNIIRISSQFIKRSDRQLEKNCFKIEERSQYLLFVVAGRLHSRSCRSRFPVQQPLDQPFIATGMNIIFQSVAKVLKFDLIVSHRQTPHRTRPAQGCKIGSTEAVRHE